MNKAMMTAVLALAVGLAGCGKKAAPPAEDTAIADPAAATPATPMAAPAATAAIDPAKSNACAKLTDVKLTATIDKATNTLKVSGTANAPTGGFATALQVGPLDKMNPPNQVVLLRANAPDGMATQAITPVTLSLDVPNALPAYNSVRVACPGSPDVELKVG
jgi:predicted small lipoprotein YifL